MNILEKILKPFIKYRLITLTYARPSDFDRIKNMTSFFDRLYIVINTQIFDSYYLTGINTRGELEYSGKIKSEIIDYL